MANRPSRLGSFSGASWLSTKPFFMGCTDESALLVLYMKLRVLNEKTASTGASEVLVKAYSKPATGRPELSSSLGIKGFQAVIVTSRGRSPSRNRSSAKGKRAVKTPSSKRGRPHVVPPTPIPPSRRPNFLYSGTLASRTLAPFSTPFTQTAANVHGSWNRSG